MNALFEDFYTSRYSVPQFLLHISLDLNLNIKSERTLGNVRAWILITILFCHFAGNLNFLFFPILFYITLIFQGKNPFE